MSGGKLHGGAPSCVDWWWIPVQDPPGERWLLVVYEACRIGTNVTHFEYCLQPGLGVNFIIALQGIYPSRSRRSRESSPNNPQRDRRSAEPYLGEIVYSGLNFNPRGWAKCEGQLLPINSNVALFSLLGTTYGGDGRTTFALPDLRGRVAVGDGNGPGIADRRLGQRVGLEAAALQANEMPSHGHLSIVPHPNTSWPRRRRLLATETDAVTPTIRNNGNSVPLSRMQPFLSVTPIIALQGVFPSRSRREVSKFNESQLSPGQDATVERSRRSVNPFIGQIKMVGFNFAQRGWAECNGALLSISQHSALFSILGTTYGGDGRTTFGLPDLRGRAAIHPGRGPGLSTFRLGQRFGTETTTLTATNLPFHDHAVQFPTNSTAMRFCKDDNSTHSFYTRNAGSGRSFSNMQPSLVTKYVIALVGVYPSRSRRGVASTTLAKGNNGGADDGIAASHLFVSNESTDSMSNTGMTSNVTESDGSAGRTRRAIPEAWNAVRTCEFFDCAGLGLSQVAGIASQRCAGLCCLASECCVTQSPFPAPSSIPTVVPTISVPSSSPSQNPSSIPTSSPSQSLAAAIRASELVSCGSVLRSSTAGLPSYFELRRRPITTRDKLFRFEVMDQMAVRTTITTCGNESNEIDTILAVFEDLGDATVASRFVARNDDWRNADGSNVGVAFDRCAGGHAYRSSIEAVLPVGHYVIVVEAYSTGSSSHAADGEFSLTLDCFNLTNAPTMMPSTTPASAPSTSPTPVPACVYKFDTFLEACSVFESGYLTFGTGTGSGTGSGGSEVRSSMCSDSARCLNSISALRMVPGDIECIATYVTSTEAVIEPVHVQNLMEYAASSCPVPSMPPTTCAHGCSGVLIPVIRHENNVLVVNSTSAGGVFFNGVDVVATTSLLYQQYQLGALPKPPPSPPQPIAAPFIRRQGEDIAVDFDGPICINGVDILTALDAIEEAAQCSGMLTSSTNTPSVESTSARAEPGFVGRVGPDLHFQADGGAVFLRNIDLVSRLMILTTSEQLIKRRRKHKSNQQHGNIDNAVAT